MRAALVLALALTACGKPAPRREPAPAPPSIDPHGFLAAHTDPAPPVPALPEAAIARARQITTGVESEVLRAGSSLERPTRTDVVVLTLDAWDVSGRHVEQYTTSEAFELSVGMPGMIDGILAMTKGEKRRLWIAEAEQGTYRLAAGTIICDVELVDIVRR